MLGKGIEGTAHMGNNKTNIVSTTWQGLSQQHKISHSSTAKIRRGKGK
jgi:hypothetical protein